MIRNFIMFLSVCLIAVSSMHALDRTAMKKQQVVFIVNPLSQEITDFDIQGIVEKNLDQSQFDYKIVYTQYPQHATELTRKALQESADIIAAVGGDGTVNEVGTALIGTNASLAIIPVGSGNGLARHLRIPVDFAKAIRALNYSHPIAIDTGKINDRPFLGIAGIGFDAHIAHKFAHFGKRGFFSYCQVSMEEFPNYEPKPYIITIDGKQFARKAFILTFANSSQFGNDFIIAPKASVNDGMLDLAIVDDVPWYSVPEFVYRIKSGNLHHFSHFETLKFKEITIQHPDIQAHVDGEPLHFQDNVKVTINPGSLKIMVPMQAY